MPVPPSIFASGIFRISPATRETITESIKRKEPYRTLCFFMLPSPFYTLLVYVYWDKEGFMQVKAGLKFGSWSYICFCVMVLSAGF